jgi:4-hydroxybenzoate polyprenyltransferase
MYKKGYPRIKASFGRLAGYVQLVRPFTLLAPFIAGIIGVITPVEGLLYEHLRIGVYAGATLALSQACGQVFNQYVDADLDAMIKPYRPIPSGVVDRDEALGIAVLLALASVGRGYLIDVMFGTLNLILIWFAVFYSLAPLSPRRVHPYVNTLWMAFSRGFLPVIAVYNIYGNINTAFLYAVLAFIWVLGFQPTKDLGDVEGDRAFGIKTMATEYGSKGLYKNALFCLCLYAFLTGYFEMWSMFFLIFVGVIAVVFGSRETSLTENNYGWVLFYLGLAIFYLLMFVSHRRVSLG